MRVTVRVRCPKCARVSAAQVAVQGSRYAAPEQFECGHPMSPLMRGAVVGVARAQDRLADEEARQSQMEYERGRRGLVGVLEAASESLDSRAGAR